MNMRQLLASFRHGGGSGTRILAVAGVLTALAASPVAGQWSQWGGPNQDFKVASKGLAETWPDTGPRQLWSRDLGEGYSGMVVVRGRVFTMYRDGEQEVVVALRAKDGETIWEHRYDAPIGEKHVNEFGRGPRSTPLVDGNRVVTIGIAGIMHCLSGKTGKVLWKKDLWQECKGTWLNHGYASSPLAYKDNLIVMVGGKGHGLMAFNSKTGKLAWKRLDFDNSYSTPKLIKVDKEDHLLCFMAKELVGVNPNNGKLKWRFEHGNRWGQNITLPVWADDGYLFLSSVEAGSRALKLTKKGKRYSVEELWNEQKIQIYHSQAIRLGDYVFGSSGMRGSGIFAAINVKNGQIAWRERGFAKATCLYADEKFIVLDEDGKLGLVKATPEEFKIICQTQLLDKVSWTVPTLVDKTLFVRDKKRIMAVDLGEQKSASAGDGPRTAS